MHEAMKGFFQSLLGSLAAFAMLCFGATVALFVLIGVLASIGEQPVIEVQANSVLVLDLNTNIQDTPPLSDFETVLQEALTGETQPTTHLLNVIESIKLPRMTTRLAPYCYMETSKPEVTDPDWQRSLKCAKQSKHLKIPVSLSTHI